MNPHSESQQHSHDRLRAAMDRLLRGELPPNGKCDLKTLAAEAGVARSALYTTHLHLKDEFEQRRTRLREAGSITDPREAQITRLNTEITTLRSRLTDRDTTITAGRSARGDPAATEPGHQPHQRPDPAPEPPCGSNQAAEANPR